MGLNLFSVLLVASVIFGIKAVWTSRLQISARREIVGPLARRVGWCMIAMPAITIAAAAACIGLLLLINYDRSLAYGQGGIFGIGFVLLATAYVANRIRRYGVPIRTDVAPLDWKNVDAKPTRATFEFLGQTSPTANDADANESVQRPSLDRNITSSVVPKRRDRDPNNNP